MDIKHPLVTICNGEFSVCVMGNVTGMVCDACSMDGGRTWIVCRVFVAPRYRRQGVGGRLLADLRTFLLAEPGAEEVQVAPGGYDTPREAQEAFYRACGFKDVPEQEGLMAYSLLDAQA